MGCVTTKLKISVAKTNRSPGRVPPGLAGTSVLTLDWGWWSSHCLDHSSRGRVGFHSLEVKNVMPPTIHWPELTTRPRPARKCYPSLCPESRKRGIVGENITPTVCPSNHQKCGSLSFLQAKYTHPPLQGDDPNSPWVRSWNKVQDLLECTCAPYSTSGCKPEAQTSHTPNAAHSTHPCHKTLRWHSQLHGGVLSCEEPWFSGTYTIWYFLWFLDPSWEIIPFPPSSLVRLRGQTLSAYFPSKEGWVPQV